VCGIAGMVDRDGPHARSVIELAERLRAMRDAIRHRGPDDDGSFVARGVALGMRRLSIIDVEGGRQPVSNEDGTMRVVFNGEIYNYRELRAELARAGHVFRTAGDTETIVHAYEEWGEPAFGRLRGMFAIALWHVPTRSLLLVRDRVGIKPLYYAESRDGLLFGSEIKALLASGDLEPALDPAGLDHLLTFLYSPPDGSLFRGVRTLPPGHLLRWRAGRCAVTRYWTPTAEPFAGSEADAAFALRAVLADAVRAHLVSDVPVGALLSGGVDSSVVVGLMAEASRHPVRTFAIGFDEARFDELHAARLVARRFGTEHHEFVVRPDAVGVVDRLVDHFDEPFGDASAIPTWYVCEMARQHVTVVLSGDGGDELFGGYDRYVTHPRVAAFDRLAGAIGRRVAQAAWRHLRPGRRGRRFLRHVAMDRRGRYVDAVSYFTPDERAALLSPDLRATIDGRVAEETLTACFDRAARLDWPSQMMRVDFETYLPEDVLTKVDRVSMAHSLEARVPLLDPAVVRFAASLPGAMKIRRGEGKQILKRAVATLLPDEILTRPKQGFGVPLDVWFRGDLRTLVGDVLQSRPARERGYFNQAFVDRLIREHLTGRRPHTLRLWMLVMFELWHRRYLDAWRRAPAALLGAAELHTNSLEVP
jgi:asparagine synthase (glutamine-hydrolysing)